MRRRLSAITVALVWALVWVAQGSAHAVLVSTSPNDGAQLEQAPESVGLRFSEAVEETPDAIRVFDTATKRVDDGEIFRPAGSKNQLAIRLKQPIPSGTYAVSYRVVSADGHPIAGAFSFLIGKSGSDRSKTINLGKLTQADQASPLVEGLFGIARGMHYLALILVIGLCCFWWFIWRLDGLAQWPGRAGIIASVAGLISSLAAGMFQIALVGGGSISSAFERSNLGNALETQTVKAWVFRIVTWLVLVGLTIIFRRGLKNSGFGLMLAGVLVVVGTLPGGGHASTHAPTIVLITADAIHILAVGAWLGTLLLVLLTYWREREHLAEAFAATSRFSRLALPAVVTLAAAGTVQAFFYTRSLSAFWSTTFGVLIAIKVVIFITILFLASLNRRRIVNSFIDEPSSRGLKRLMVAEVGLALIVIGATAALVRSSPPVSLAKSLSAHGKVVRDLNAGPLTVHLEIAPARIGGNDVRVTLRDQAGKPVVVDEVEAFLSFPAEAIGPIRVNLRLTRGGVFRNRSVALPAAGLWIAEIDAREGDFDQFVAKTSFEVWPR